MPGNVAAGISGINKAPRPILDESKMRPLPGAAEIATRSTPCVTSPPLDVPPAVAATSSAPVEKEKGMNPAKKLLQDDHPSLDHLSAPPSAMQSGTTTPHPEPASVSPAESGSIQPQQSHRGSEVKDAGAEEIKQVESKNALHEEDGESDVGAVSKETQSTQEQEAKEPDDASKSVGD